MIAYNRFKNVYGQAEQDLALCPPHETVSLQKLASAPHLEHAF